MKRIPRDTLRVLRNQIDIVRVIETLGIETTRQGRGLTFRCPGCGELHARVNPRTQMARCFACSRSFNAIDILIHERAMSFLEAVAYLERLVD
jgi:DNA primase